MPVHARYAAKLLRLSATNVEFKSPSSHWIFLAFSSRGSTSASGAEQTCIDFIVSIRWPNGVVCRADHDVDRDDLVADLRAAPLVPAGDDS